MQLEGTAVAQYVCKELMHRLRSGEGSELNHSYPESASVMAAQIAMLDMTPLHKQIAMYKHIRLIPSRLHTVSSLQAESALVSLRLHPPQNKPLPSMWCT